MLSQKLCCKMSFSDVLATIGGLTVAFYLLKLSWTCCCGLREYFLSKLWQVNLRRYGQWAVVTGATSGIGKAYACEVTISLKSRNDPKCSLSPLEKQYGRKTRTIQVDFTEGHSIYPAIAEQLQGLEIGILVNNVGMVYSDCFTYFLDVPDAGQVISLIQIKMTLWTFIFHLLHRKTGLIINISSEAGIRPQPLLSLYCATKIFVTYFSQCLHAEYKSMGITVQCVAPFIVSTKMTNMKVNSFVKSAPEFAHDALNTVGHSNYTSGCLSHALQDMALAILLPDWIRMSSFLIIKLANQAKRIKSERRVCKENLKIKLK
uniref:Hydroxysteroid (20-beta) dehydrogenase 2 n=1 Tax=Mastacembelus armatus TaxID=205130 RepID=A0A3Q3MP70_9TELE